jgi:hypothetical protein
MKVFMAMAATVTVIAFGLGMAGVPGDAVSAAATWLVDSGHVTVAAPVSDAVRQAL